MRQLRGVPVAGGSRVGRALLWDESPPDDITAAMASASPPEDIEAEIVRLNEAARATRQDLQRHAGALESHGPGVGEIFKVHQAMLADFLPRVERVIRDGSTAQHAVATVFHAYAARLAKIEDPVLALRAQDVVDLERSLLSALAGVKRTSPNTQGDDGPVVVIARDLTPSEVARLEPLNVAGLVLELGGATSHAAVIAKSLGFPVVMGVRGVLEHVQPGDTLWVNGSTGEIVIDPDAATVERAVGLGERYEALEASLLRESHLPAETLDGHRAQLLANVEYPLDVAAGAKRGADGVGLFRTEFLYDGGGSLPSEDDHLAMYRDTLAQIGDKRLTIRTYDFGADKGYPLPAKVQDAEPNPALGARSLRWCFAHPEAFRTQIRAILRVAAEGDVRIMLPMVSGLEEVRRAKAFIQETSDELTRDDVPHRSDLPIGVMIEIPSAAVVADILAPEVDFFSIGTNDLIQYGLAVDRVNPHVADLFRPSHPSLLRLIGQTVTAAERAEIPVTMCGEMGGHSIYTVLLFGLGIREFSLTPGYIPRARRLLRSLTLVDARRIAAEALRARTCDEVEAHLHRQVVEVGAG